MWKVTIEHEPLDNIKKDVTSITDYIRKYCNKDYYIDATTGEIVGGNDNLAAGNYSKEMLRRSWGNDEYERILEKYSRKLEGAEDTVHIED